MLNISNINRVMQPDTLPIQPEPSETPPPIVPAPQPKPKSRWPKLYIAILLLIIIAAGVGLLLHKSHKTTTVTATKKDIPLIKYGVTAAEVPQYPINAQGSSVDAQISAQLFEPLVQYQDQTKIVPWLATSWSNPDTLTWIFNLRHGVKFHSGRIMTATDVKFTLDYAVAHQNDFNDSSIFATASTIKQIDVLGPYQVKVTTTIPDAVLLNKLSFFGIVDSKATLGDYDAGSGPYVVKPGTTPNAKAIKLVASNSYWAGHVYTREVDEKVYDSVDQIAADEAVGKLDLGGNFNADQLSKIKNYRPVDIPDQGVSYLGLATERTGSPLSALSGRQAVAYGLNTSTVLKAAGLNGQLANQLVPVQLPGHNPSIPDTPYNIDKAKQLLATSPNPTMQLTLAYDSSADLQVNEIVKELTAAGFNIKPIRVDDFGALINDTTAGKYDLFYLSDASSTVDGLDILTTLLLNNNDYDNPQIDSLTSKAVSTFDPAARIKLLQQVATIVNNEKPIIPLYTLTRTYALKEPNYHVKVDLPSLGAGNYFWKTYQD